VGNISSLASYEKNVSSPRGFAMPEENGNRKVVKGRNLRGYETPAGAIIASLL
jgi:hypothetical protein